MPVHFFRHDGSRHSYSSLDVRIRISILSYIIYEHFGGLHHRPSYLGQVTQVTDLHPANRYPHLVPNQLLLGFAVFGFQSLGAPLQIHRQVAPHKVSILNTATCAAGGMPMQRIRLESNNFNTYFF